jgi:hypothetical protein
MVWEKEVECIVMLTNLVELGVVSNQRSTIENMVALFYVVE